jgi:3',5'-cyclic AMP phosphodiesterase CpdA
VPTRALHVSDLHAGRRETAGLGDAFAELVAQIEPELVIATGDLAHRGRRSQLERAHALLSGSGRPFLAVPGNHDIPYTFPGRFSHPWRSFERVFGTTEPVYSSHTLVVAGLNSVRPTRQQGGRLSVASLERAAFVLGGAQEGALRVVALHHHLAGAPWRTSRKFPLKHRDAVLPALAAAGAELVVGGHIHQAAVAERREFDTRSVSGSVVLVTSPGLGRPRPRRSGEAQGALLYEWDHRRFAVETLIWDGSRFGAVARREFARA